MIKPSVPAHYRLDPPLIVLGMHRSGTTMLTQLLEACGLFVGRDLDRNHEARFFRLLNDDVLEAGGGGWERAEPYLAVREEPAFAQRMSVQLGSALERGFSRRFLTLTKCLALTAGQRFPWGWKDPRTCLTLPHWLAVFASARLVHIVRHPLDVAISLQKREEKQIAIGELVTEPVRDLDYSMELWDTYVRECLRYRARGDRYLEMRFEDFLAAPQERLRQVCDFAGLAPTAGQRENALAMVDSSRQRRFDDRRYAPWLPRVRSLPAAVEFGYA